jgi:hypothetical protein
MRTILSEASRWASGWHPGEAPRTDVDRSKKYKPVNPAIGGDFHGMDTVHADFVDPGGAGDLR